MFARFRVVGEVRFGSCGAEDQTLMPSESPHSASLALISVRLVLPRFLRFITSASDRVTRSFRVWTLAPSRQFLARTESSRSAIGRASTVDSLADSGLRSLNVETAGSSAWGRSSRLDSYSTKGF